MLKNINKSKKTNVRKSSKQKDTDIVLSTADSDFAPPEYIRRHISKNILEGDFTYKRAEPIFSQSIIPFLQRNNFEKFLSSENLIYGMGAVHILQLGIMIHTKPGDYVLVTNPIYGPFIKIIKSLDRKVAFIKISNSGINEKELNQIVKNKNIKLFLFCNPHNPTNFVFGKKDLNSIKKVIYQNNGFIYSDEVWSNMIFQGDFISYAALDSSEGSRIVSINGLGKPFNLHSLNFGYGVSYNTKLISKINNQMRKTFASSHKNNLVLSALEIAYKKEPMEKWLKEYKNHIIKNYKHMQDNLKSSLIQVPELKSTYVIFLDFKNVKCSHENINSILLKNGIILSDGKSFGTEGKKKFRILLSVSHNIFQKAINKIANIKEFNV